MAEAGEHELLFDRSGPEVGGVAGGRCVVHVRAAGTGLRAAGAATGGEGR
jgi:hypothetical protein